LTPNAEETMPDGSHASAADAATHSHTLLDRLPPHILGGLTVEQRAAIAAASGDWKAAAHRVNLRLSLPLLPKRWYFPSLAVRSDALQPVAASNAYGIRFALLATWPSSL
jgi:hypothetical protein